MKIEIHTENLILRPLNKEDITQEYINNLNDPDINQFISTRGITQTIESLHLYINNYSGKIFGIFLNNNHIGNLTLFSDTVGILVFKEYQRKGYAKEAINAICYLGYDKARINSDNSASINLFTNCGFYVRIY